MSGRLAGGRPVSTVCMASPAIHGGGGGTHTDHRPFLIIQMTNHITSKVFWYLMKRRL